MNDRQIKWQSYHWEDINFFPKSNDEINEDFEDEEFDDPDLKSFSETIKKYKDKLPTVVQTPLGAVFESDKMNPFKILDYRMAHTNFDIDEDVVGIVNIVPGVEVLKVISRYQFLVGVGALFKSSEVMSDVTIQLGANVEK